MEAFRELLDAVPIVSVHVMDYVSVVVDTHRGAIHLAGHQEEELAELEPQLLPYGNRAPKGNQLLILPLRGSRTARQSRTEGVFEAPGQGLEPQIRAPEARVLPITPSRIGVQE